MEGEGKVAIERSSNVREELSQRAFFGFIPGIVIVAVAGLMIAYKTAWMMLAYVLLIIGAAALAYGIAQLFKMRKVTDISISCPFCSERNFFTIMPDDDVRCTSCLREIPVADGKVLAVFQVQCGKCSGLNYYTEKSTGLICEFCDSVIPIATDEGPDAAQTFEKFTAHDPGQPVDLYLSDPGPHREKMIEVLQKMLSLNRNQVKEIIDEVPSILLIGIPAKKAEYLVQDIEKHGGRASIETHS